MSATARLDMRLQSSLKQEAERAAALVGARSLTEFVVQAIREKTATVLDEKERIVLTGRDFDVFIAACEEATMPCSGLKKAAAKHDEQGFM
ncbi:MAG: DUF1778 domain-containing protein [Mariprofundus sp.]